MKHLSILVVFLIACSCKGAAQTAITCTNPAAEQALLGNYPHTGWFSTSPMNYDDTISRGINARVSPDSLRAYLEVLRSFQNRNSGSDTVSTTRGIGAARRWVYNKFQDFSAREGGKLLPSYLQFNMNLCGQQQHRNIFSALPGSDTNDKSVVLIEGHMDSRCAGLCDTACLAEGMEDNGSGTALVMELARVMSRYKYRRTIVFLITIGEEQSLAGATAFANYIVQKGINLHAVFNNDVIGGIVCGQTSSPPSCPGPNAIDSTNVRIFSYGGLNSAHKQLARFVKLEYKEQFLAYVWPWTQPPGLSVPMNIHIMSAEDRTGRGGDHIPFRQNGYTSVRFTSANEHGDASLGSGYTDRQHTSSDILGIDRNNDGSLDSFFVDFDYLARNAVINGNGAAMAAIGLKTPGFTTRVIYPESLGTEFTFSGVSQAWGYSIAVRSTTNDWDYIYPPIRSGTVLDTVLPNWILSVAAVDSNGVESLFSSEQLVSLAVSGPAGAKQAVQLLQNTPNPFDEATTISVLVREALSYKEAYIRIAEAGGGKEVQRLPILLKKGVAEVTFRHGYGAHGTYVYSLIIDGRQVDSRKMVFAN